ncbi:hypothetical protein AMS68_004468 [Peltaster fructicola]|uniref:YTH domain-containing protein n=1 Tax=Peltaster fructicola TaxID=286661 RepID=A0A6H0XWB0_9PEZI|nr:hypothetical protein AMS68_004468 [Peltaster fructicola]
MPTYDQSNGPPAKKVKTGGMITTKYAPPPGYVPPAAQTTPYNAWGYGVGAGNQQAYDLSMQQAQQYWAAYGYSYPGYPDYSAYYQQYSAQPYAQSPYATHVPQSAHPLTSHSAAWPAPPQPHNLVEQAARQRHNSAPSINIAGAFDQGKASGPNDDLDESHEDYCEYTRPCYYATRESEIVKDLSIGLVNMKTALPAHKALPATWTEANEVASAPDPKENCTIQLKACRETSEWNHIKNDLIFRSLPLNTTNLVNSSRLKSDFRNRIDTVWLENKPNLRRPSVQQPQQRRGSDQHSSSNKKRMLSQTDTEPSGDDHNKRSRQESRSQDRYHGVNGPASNDLYNDRRSAHESRQDDQDAVLARLGVTGPPRPVSSHAVQRTAASDTSPHENKWTRLAREHYPGNKRGFDHDQEDDQQMGAEANVTHQDKRRK